jgi:hypothetical protein
MRKTNCQKRINNMVTFKIRSLNLNSLRFNRYLPWTLTVTSRNPEDHLRHTAPYTSFPRLYTSYKLCPAHFTLIDFITLIFHSKVKSQIFSVCSCFHSLTTSSSLSMAHRSQKPLLYALPSFTHIQARIKYIIHSCI